MPIDCLPLWMLVRELTLVIRRLPSTDLAAPMIELACEKLIKPWPILRLLELESLIMRISFCSSIAE